MKQRQCGDTHSPSLKHELCGKMQVYKSVCLLCPCPLSMKINELNQKCVLLLSAPMLFLMISFKNIYCPSMFLLSLVPFPIFIIARADLIIGKWFIRHKRQRSTGL